MAAEVDDLPVQNPPYLPLDNDDDPVATPRQLLQELDKATESLKQNWKGEIIVKLDRNGTGNLEDFNICDYIGRYKGDCHDRLYFNTSEFPPPPVLSTNIPKDDRTWNELKLYISRCGHESGSPVSSNGTQRGNRRFVCFCHRLYSENQQNPKKIGDFRQDSLVDGDKKGRRSAGREAPRRCLTKRAIKRKDVCNFKFNIGWDSKGYFLIQTAGSPVHNGHPKIEASKIPIPSRLIPKAEIENLHALAVGSLGAGAGRNFLQSKLGRYVGRAKVAYLQQTADVHFEGHDVPSTDVDKLLSFFNRSKEITYQVLWDVPVDDYDSESTETAPSVTSKEKKLEALKPCNSDKASHFTKGRSGSISSADSTHGTVASLARLISQLYNREEGVEGMEICIDHTTETGMEELVEEAGSARSAACVPTGSKIFLCIAWANFQEIRQFKRFPHLLYCDATGSTNNTGNHLVTFSGRTPWGRQFIFLRVWVHNQKLSTFQWIFRAVVPNFIPEKTFKQVQVCMVDGDAQQRTKLIEAINKHMPNAMHSTCAYHLVTQKWWGKVPKSSIPKKLWGAFERLWKFVHNWLLSFFRPGYCESREEYEMSKKILYFFLYSKEVRRVLSSKLNFAKVIQWIRNSVLTRENEFLYFQRKGQRYYFQITNSPHEGTNFAAKHSSGGVMGCHTMTQAGKNLSLQGAIKIGKMSDESTKYIQAKPVWTKSDSSHYLVTNAESIVRQSFDHSKNYTVHRTSFGEWQVVYNFSKASVSDTDNSCEIDEFGGGNQMGKENWVGTAQQDGKGNLSKPAWTPIPRFHRIREVKLSPQKYLNCSCFRFESTGLPCHHTAAVIQSCFPEWCGFTHHDCGLEWWRIWGFYAYDTTAPQLSALLLNAKMNSPLGASFPSADRRPPEPTLAYAQKKNQSIMDCIVNYTNEKLEEIVEASKDSSNYEGMSQTSLMLDDDGLPVEPEEYSVEDGIPSFPELLETDSGEEREDVFQVLKNELYEMLRVLDRHRTLLPEKDMISTVRSEFQKHTNAMRADLHEENNLKRPYQDGSTVNIMSEGRRKSTRREYHSKNCR